MQKISETLHRKTQTGTESQPSSAPAPRPWPEISPAFAHFDAGHPAARLALDGVQDWVHDTLDGIGRGLVLWASDKKGNGYGNGKTMLAKCARQALVMGGMSVVSIVFTTSEKFLDDVKASYDSHSTTHTFKMYRSAPAVIVDDFGTEYFKEAGWYQEQWYKLLNHAYDARQPFLLTSNLQPGEIQERLGGKNWSRLEGHTGRAFINMSALPDRRVK